MSKRLSVRQAKMLHKHRYILKKLASSSIKDKRKILSNAPGDLFKVLNIIFKLLNENKIDLPTKDKQKIRKHRQFIRSASGHNIDLKSQLSKQRGGSFQKVLSTVLPIIGTIVKTLI